MEFEIIDGIKCFAPKLALQNDDYPSEAFSILYHLEKDNFWFDCRNRVISSLVKNYLKIKKTKFLEIGCGTGYVLKNLHINFPDFILYGSEIYLEGIHFAKKRVPQANFVQLDATKMPYENEFDAIGAFDVLEHIEDDVSVMKGVHKALSVGGYFFISVPQHPFMWSVTDDIAFHKRRYTRKELSKKLKSAGFKIEYSTSFVFTLFSLMLVSRFFSRNKTQEITKELIIQETKKLEVGKNTNQIFSILMKIDEFLINNMVSLPFGGSLMVVAKKI